MKNTNVSRLPKATLAAVALLAAFTTTANAQLYWSGDGSTIGGSGTWDTTNQRWDDTFGGPFDTVWNNTTHASTQAFFLTTVGNVTVQAGGISVGTITPMNASAVTPWVFTGGDITLGSRIGPTSGSAQMNASFSNNISLPNATTFNFRGTTSTLNISGQLSGAGKVTNERGNNLHTLTLTGDNSGWSGGMTMLEMNFVLGHNSALGTGLVEVGAASPVISATTPLTAINTPFQHAATGGTDHTALITLSGDHAMTFNGNLSWSSGVNVVNRGFDVTSSEVMTWNGVISQTASAARNFLKSGSGTLVLGGANTYTGATTVNDGQLVLNNSSGSATGSGSILVANASTLTMNSGSSIVMGSGTEFVVNSNASFTQSAGSTWTADLFHINGNGSGALSVANLADSASGDSEIRFGFDASGNRAIDLTSATPFNGTPYSNPTDWKAEWRIGLAPDVGMQAGDFAGFDIFTSAGVYDLTQLDGHLNIRSYFTSTLNYQDYPDVGQGSLITLQNGNATAVFSVNFTQDSIELVLSSARAIPEPSTLGLLSLALGLVGRTLRKGKQRA